MIGRRCATCKKLARYHNPVTNTCPMGKKRNYAYEEFHPTNKFTPREPKKRGGSEKRKLRSVRREIKAGLCIACRAGNCDPAHVRGWLISQCDEPWNIVSFCRPHHDMQGRRGWLWMALRYPSVAQELKSLGWEFIVNESTGDWGMFNPLEVEFQKRRRAV